MSKHVKTLSAIGSAIAGWSNTVAANDATRKTLLVQCEKLTLVEKQRVDGELVAYYAEKAGVEVKAREKAHALFCSSVPAWEKNAKGFVDHPAAMALSRARGVLFAKEKAPAKQRASGTATATTSAKPLDFDTLLPTVGSFAEKMVGTTLTKEQAQSIRHTVLLLQGLLNNVKK